MDRNGNYRNLVTSPYSFLYNYNPCPDTEMKRTEMADTNYGMVSMMGKSTSYGGSSSSQEKKKRLTSGQLELLERSFQEEVKLDPDRKMKLSEELGLQPRQIAIWFQNRRARWKTKQLEHLYDALKQEFDVISREKQMLQEEVLKLKAILSDQTSRKQLSDGCAVISGEETVESTSDTVPSSEKTRELENRQEMAECSYLPDIDVSPPFWGALCSYPE